MIIIMIMVITVFEGVFIQRVSSVTFLKGRFVAIHCVMSENLLFSYCEKQTAELPCILISPFLLPSCYRFFIFLFYRFFSQQVRVGGRNKN